jgi:acyl transferase domain-containing protein
MTIEAVLSSLTEADRDKLRRSMAANLVSTPIAIIGLSGRYPKSADHYQFWDNIAAERNLIGEIPTSRFDYTGRYRETKDRQFERDKVICKYGAFIEDHDCFDAEFFEVPPSEVPYMDPQQRIALETTWSCIEDAGYTPTTLGANVGVFGAVTYCEYEKLLPVSGHASFLANRIAYHYNFIGPAVTTDAGCCSSLCALDLACRNLCWGDCDRAIVVGANLILHPDHYASLVGLLSTSGKPLSNPFGVDDGWIPAEAVVSVVLKRLEDAEKDHDHVYAIIKSSAVAQDGKGAWFGASNPTRQADLIRINFGRAGIHPESISYVEAAANGSSFGDAIEFEAIAKGFAELTDKKGFCAIGSVKSNVGHGEAVSTLIQLTKVILQLQTRALLPTINLERINPNLRQQASPVYLQQGRKEWDKPNFSINGQTMEIPRRATISSFGAGGNLGHLVIEEGSNGSTPENRLDRCLLPLSSRTAEQLIEHARGLLHFVDKMHRYDVSYRDRNNLLNMMYTLTTGRVAFGERVAFVASSVESLSAQLRDFVAGKDNPDVIKKGDQPEGADLANDSSEFLNECLARESWHSVAMAWVNGVEIDWARCFAQRSVYRIPLPTYRFKKTKYRVFTADDVPSHDGVSTSVDAHLRQPLKGSSGSDAFETGASMAPVEQQPTKLGDEVRLNDRVLDRLKEVFNGVAGVGLERIKEEEALGNYGIDSNMIAQLNEKLSAVFERLPKTVFYEYSSLKALCDYLVEGYPVECLRWTAMHDTGYAGKAKRREQSENDGQQETPPRDHTPKRRASQSGPVRREKIAIVGMSARFPGANSLSDYWQNLRNGKNCIGLIPPGRWSFEDFFVEDVETAVERGKSYSKWGAFVEGFAEFDPVFFNISPRDAASMDPHERMFLQECWKAFEDAGYVVSRLSEAEKDNVGVYGAITKRGVNASFAGLVNRVSHAFDLRGPSVAVDTMCSSSLVALHRACEDLRNLSVDMALVGGVNLYLTAATYFDLSKARLLSSTRFPLVFEKGGKGFVPSEGVGAVVLKRLADAERDNDDVLATILGSAMNHSGRTSGFMVPNPNQQASVIKRALESAGLEPSLVDYVELAAGGSEMGDAIELGALTKVFDSRRQGARRLRVGSLKTFLGHGEAVSGMAQLMKVILQLRHRMLCPAVSARATDPNIGLGEVPFEIQTRLSDWDSEAVDGLHPPRRAGITSVGAGGVNAHLVVEEYPSGEDRRPLSSAGGQAVVFVLSAKSKAALAVYLSTWREYLKTNESTDLARVCYTLQTGREAMKYRFSCVVSHIDELADAIDSALAGVLPSNAFANSVEQEETGTASDEELKTAERGRDESFRRLVGAARAWTEGNDIRWEELRAEHDLRGRMSGLPTYPFRNATYWQIPPGAAWRTERTNDPVVAHVHGHQTERPVHEPSLRGNSGLRNGVVRREIAVPKLAGGSNAAADYYHFSETVRRVVREILAYDDVEEIEETSNFAEIGFSSVTIVKFAHELTRILGRRIPETIAFDYPTIVELAKHLASECNDSPAPGLHRSSSNGSPLDGNEGVGTSDASAEGIRNVLLRIAEGTLTVEDAEQLID